MSELLCSQGHVLDTGRDVCSRCGGQAVRPEPAIAPEVPASESAPEMDQKTEEAAAEEPKIEKKPRRKRAKKE